MPRHRTPLLHAKPKKLDDVRSDINVTPLVDVCLVLLIIFMVVTEKLTRGKDVQLPKTKNHEVKKDVGDDLIVSVSKSGGHTQIWWDRDPLSDVDALKKRLDEELHRHPRLMFFKADADLKYADVYPVLIAIYEGGSPEIQIGTQDLKESP